MPSYKTHLAGGLITYLLVYKVTTILHLVRTPDLKHHLFFAGLTLLGSIFPDIDVSSKMQQLFWLAALIALPSALFLHKFHLFVGIGAVCLSLLFIHHRTLTHRFWFITLLPLTGALLFASRYPSHKHLFFSACIFFAAGAASHLILDRGIRRFFS